jgi:membrane-bound lytic murein transglycosylase A
MLPTLKILLRNPLKTFKQRSDLRLLWVFILLNGACLGTLSMALPTLAQVLFTLATPKATISPERDRRNNSIISRFTAEFIQVDGSKISPDRNLLDDLLESDRPQLIQAIDRSLKFIRTPTASKLYPRAGISRDRMEKSLVRFRYLAENTVTSEEFQQAIAQEFILLQSPGLDGKGNVQFTGYYEAVYAASRQRTPEFKYPLYRLPPDLQSWRDPHPSRAELEKSDRLKGLEIAYLRDRFQAFLIHVQGSAQLQLTDNTTLTVGYAGKTDRSYNSIGKELVKDGKFKLEDVTLQALISYFEQHPQELEGYLWRNPSFVFFRETFGKPATGSIGVAVTPERTIATDKSIMPPGGIALIRTQIPIADPTGKLEFRPISRFVLDQDTGGAIKGAGRVDIFMGTGDLAKQRAGLISGMGELYYLVLK